MIEQNDLSWIAPTVMAAGSLIASITAAYLAVRAANHAAKAREDVAEVKVATNHMKDALVAAALVQGHSEGLRDEKASRALKDVAAAEAKREGAVEATQQAQAVKDSRAEGMADERARSADPRPGEVG